MPENTAPTSSRPEGAIDARGPRVSAAFTSVFLLVGIFLAVTGLTTAGVVVFAAVAILFAWSLVSGRTQPLSLLYRRAIQPRLGPVTEWEDPRPPRFAQGVGLAVVGVGLLLHILTVPWALVIAGVAAFIAAALNASIGFCLGCEIYLLLSRAGVIGRRAAAAE